MADTIEDLDPLMRELIALGDMKVWSVLVTIFGDLASEEGQFIPGTVLTQVCDALGIKPAALRVALHRLNKDGWLLSRKAGRVSHYSLSTTARQQTLNARHTVYGPYPSPPETLFVMTVPSALKKTPTGWLAVSTKTYVTDQMETKPNDSLISEMKRQELPPWARDTAVPEHISKDYRLLDAALAVHNIPKQPLPALQATLLRQLILHRWRRIVLRHDPVAFAILGPEWAGTSCSQKVQAWLSALPRQDASKLMMST